MPPGLEQAVRDVLLRHEPAGIGLDLAALQVTPEVRIDGDRAAVRVDLPIPVGDMANAIRDGLVQVVQSVPGVRTAAVDLTGHVPAASAASELLPGVRNILAVSSGKGGVGKSTVTVNVAAALSRSGARVGVLDADVYGPNVPIMFGVTEAPVVLDGRIQPLERYGVRLMSLGFLVRPEDAVIWRGPMVMQALQQMMRDVSWGELDYLLVDMPPGTGDAQLTMVQSVPLAGAVLVSTPQAVALGDTIKGLMMFRKTDTPVLGMVENMSLFHCPHCHQPTELFKRGTVEGACRRYDVPFLGDVPFDLDCREGGDSGVPIAWSEPDSASGRAFAAIAARLAARVALEAGRPTHRVPDIVRR